MQINTFADNNLTINDDVLNIDNDINKMLNVSKCLQEMINVMDDKMDLLKTLCLSLDVSKLNDDIKNDVSSLYFFVDDKLRAFKKYQQLLMINMSLNCVHDYETDYIDNNAHICKEIIYCKKCEIDKNIIDEYSLKK